MDLTWTKVRVERLHSRHAEKPTVKGILCASMFWRVIEGGRD